jgi:phosphopantothenoylcysteine decarboxylase/phosphopantothenate--cysteine ligase
MAKAAHGIANDLASTTLLATDKRVLFVPAMNVRMWEAPATKRNVQTLKNDGQYILGPDAGEMACGEFGFGRMSEPEAIADAIENLLSGDQSLDAPQPLKGRHALITAGPTREPIDPVRYLSNHSSGKQGYAIASALRALGAEVTLVSGPTALPAPVGVKTVNVETARDMLTACETALPADIFIGVAAVADWHVKGAGDEKIKKDKHGLPELHLAENPDILGSIANGKNRPTLVVGFAAETNDVIKHAKAKLTKKNCDMIVANDVSGDVMGGDENAMIIVSKNGEDAWPRMDKMTAAQKLAGVIATRFEEKT